MRRVVLQLAVLYTNERVSATTGAPHSATCYIALARGWRAFFLPVLLIAIIAIIFAENHPVEARPISEIEDVLPTHVFADHVVISEVQTAGISASDEFVEIYNPTNASILIESWSLQYLPAAGGSYQKKNFVLGATIPAYGFYLIANSGCTCAASADMAHSSIQLAGGGGHIFLVGDQTTLTSPESSLIIDKFGYGSAAYPEGGAFNPAPSPLESAERKAFYFSDQPQMVNEHEPYGNSYDTDDNAVDFTLQNLPKPQNNSFVERCCTTVEGTLSLQGRTDSTGIQVLFWPGSGLRTTTDSSGKFSIPVVPAIASEDTVEYTVGVVFPGYLSAKTTLDLTSSPLSNSPVTFPALRLLAGDINSDNRVNIFDLT
ncbi:MAG TPA: lamin tail domain-containing protein, partial [Caldilineaceae bacterium]|nr:lamin tail domain-containing protein [Caldilineaceae bacterium]